MADSPDARTMHGPTPWRSRLMLAMSVAGCQAFPSYSHLPSTSRRIRLHRYDTHYSWRQRRRRQPRESDFYLTSHKNRERCDSEHEDTFSDAPDSSPDLVLMQQNSVFAVTAASFVFVGSAFSFTLGHVEGAVALDTIDTTATSILQRKKVRDDAYNQTPNSLQVMFQRFLHDGAAAAPTISRTTKLTQHQQLILPTIILSSDQGAVIEPTTKPKENAKVRQQMVANPTASENKSSTTSTKQTQPTSADVPPPKSKKTELQATDVKQIATENKIDIELVCKDDQRPLLDSSAPVVKIDRETFQKIKVYQPPFLQYLPSSVQPLISRQFQSLKVLKSIPNDQLFYASVFAGSLTEIIRTGLLYPLSTIKARVQARTLRSTAINRNKRSLPRKLKVTWLTALHETKRGDLYAGITPSLLVAVPASGVYSGMKEVSRRAFSMAIQMQVFQNLFPGDNDGVAASYGALVASLLAAFVADIASLAIRTPADVLALRLQVFGDKNVKSDFGDWAKDSVALLPAMILTDIPFLLSRIFLNAAITTGGENLGKYEFETITIGE